MEAKIKVLNPQFDSKLMDLIIEMERLKERSLGGTTHEMIFFQLKDIFHILESIGSSRIEGNNTTIAEYIETKIPESDVNNHHAALLEISNIEKAMKFIEETVAEYPINKSFVSELHKIVVENLSPAPLGEGDPNPGVYRSHNVSIYKSSHKPIDYIFINDYMEELINFINEDHGSKYELIKMAIVHHRFAWIHPFSNGNGRTVRLLTYAMLVKSGYRVEKGRIINPVAIFCTDRNKYYDKLSLADNGSEEGMLAWCEYVIEGLKKEVDKVYRLTDYSFVKDRLLNPMLELSFKNKMLNEIEYKILKIAVEKQVMQAGDIDKLFPGKSPNEKTRQINKLLDKNLLIRFEGQRKYGVNFGNNYLLRSIMQVLDKEGFLPMKLDS